MTTVTDWLEGFPIQQAEEAVEVLCKGWGELARQRLPHFHPEMSEPRLTKRLKVYVEDYVARNCGLLGNWTSENVTGEIDPDTGNFKERHTDIAYNWNDNTRNMQVVFEFKKVSYYKRTMNDYLGDEGIGRFVRGIYSKEEPLAAMVGILLASRRKKVVLPIQKTLDNGSLATRLKLCKTAGGNPYTCSSLFKQADFDTEHNRGPTYGVIRVAHLFFAFGYPTTTRRPKKRVI